MVCKRLLSTPLLLLASGCAVVGPIYDRSFEEAPHSACAQLAGAGPPAIRVGQQPVGIGCFEIVGRTLSSYGSVSPVKHDFTPEGLAVTNNAAFRLRGGEGCTGMFTNFVIEYATPQGGSAMLVATNALGAVLGTKPVRGDASPKLRRTVMREMGDPLKDPTTLEIGDVEGVVVIGSVCLKGY